VQKYIRFVDGLRNFIKSRMEPQEAIDSARTLRKKRIAAREDNVLNLADKGIFHYSRSPYLRLLEPQRISLNDLESWFRKTESKRAFVLLADWEGVLAMYLSEYERGWFSRLASSREPEMSYRLWTIKEARLKAIGIGLSISPADIEVSLDGENEYRCHSINGESEWGRNWSIMPFTPATNFSASVVVEAGPTRIIYFHCEPRRLLDSYLS